MTTLRTTWVCEFCHENTHGENPPDICDICGGVYFDNGQDLANERGVVPTRTRPVDFSVEPEYADSAVLTVEGREFFPAD